MSRPHALIPVVSAALMISAATPLPALAAPESPASVMAAAEGSPIAPYVARFGRSRPIIAIIGENSGTELADFAIPYGVLSQSHAADVLTVATQAGPIKMRPALTVQPDATIAEFDRRFPDGADYVIVPAVVRSADPALLTWVAAQGRKGATVVSICDGAFVVANAGLMKDRNATAHWASYGFRRKTHPEVKWQKNVRYVADGKVVSSAGISAAMPTSLALVEAIAGHAAAAEEARALGVADCSPRHNSEVFEPHLGNLVALISVNYTNTWFRTPDRIGVPVSAQTDEIALGFTADAWSRTGLSHAYGVAAHAGPMRTRNGLTIIPDVVGSALKHRRKALMRRWRRSPSAMADRRLMAWRSISNIPASKSDRTDP